MSFASRNLSLLCRKSIFSCNMLNTTYSTLGKQLKKVTPITASQILHYHPPGNKLISSKFDGLLSRIIKKYDRKKEEKFVSLKLCVLKNFKECQIKAEGKLMSLKLGVKSSFSCNMMSTSYSTLGKQLKKMTASQIFHYHPPGNKLISSKFDGLLSKIIKKYDRKKEEKFISLKLCVSKNFKECQIKAEGKLMPLKLCVKAVEEWSLFLIGSGVLIFGIWLIYDFVKPIRDDDGTILDDEFSALPLPEKCWKRTCRELNYYKERFLGLRNGKILPDPLDKQPQYTLVLEFTDLLVHPDWTYQTNWRFKKRPGVDQFLEQLVPYFEIVIYTDLYAHMFFPLLGRLNPNVHMFGLARGSTRYINGHNVKDLDVLNRNLSKVIVIDWNKISIQLQPQNAILIPRWNGNDDDTTLIELSAFLTMIHATNVADVRDIIKYYQQFDNPLEAFRENERKLLKQMKKWEKYKNSKCQYYYYYYEI